MEPQLPAKKQAGFPCCTAINSQEFVTENQDLPCARNAEPFWVQVGQIAMFDWLTGRNDLFNDLLVGGEAALAENMDVNKDNIKPTPSQAVEIDLGFSEPCCLDDFVEILNQLGQRRVDWVPSHILVLMCEGRSGGLGSLTCSSAFGHYSPLKSRGWHPEISKLQVGGWPGRSDNSPTFYGA